VRLGKHLDELAASASVAWALEPAKNTQVEKRKLFRRRLSTVITRGWKAFPVPSHGPDVKKLCALKVHNDDFFSFFQLFILWSRYWDAV
jgi:hypothetical protein